MVLQPDGSPARKDGEVHPLPDGMEFGLDDWAFADTADFDSEEQA